MLSTYTGILWWIVYTRAEGLIRLQFEPNYDQDRLIDSVSSYKAIIRSIGSAHNDNTSAEILHEIYHRVMMSCNSYYNQIGINTTVPLPPKLLARLKYESMGILGTRNF